MDDLVIFTVAGLCNRLKIVFSGLRIAEKTNRQVKLFWNPERVFVHPDTFERHSTFTELNFSDLFSTPIQEIDRKATEKVNWGIPPDSGDIWVYKMVDRNQTGTIMRSGWQILHFEDEPRCDFLYINNKYQEYPEITADLRKYALRLVPVDHLVKKIDDFCRDNNIGSNTIGVHRRLYHDHCKNINDENFIENIRHFLSVSSSASIFVASDDNGPERLIKETFPERVISYPKRSRDMTSISEWEDAVIDLYILSRCGFFVGSDGSTFSEMVWWLRGHVENFTICGF